MSETFYISAELHAENTNTTETVSLPFPSIPATFDEIKQVVEESFSIPSYSQTVVIHGNKVQGSEYCTPSSLYMQSGDAIKIEFPGKCDCKEVKKVIKWLTDCISTIQSIKRLNTEIEVKLMFEKHIFLLADRNMLKTLSLHLFSPWSDKVKLMNAAYFDHLGGLMLLVKSHQEFRSLRESNLFKLLHRFSESQEWNYCLALGMFASSPANRRRVAQCGGLDRCIETFLVAKADESRAQQMVEVSLIAISNISDVPENQCYISKNKNVIEQVLAVIASPHSYENRRVITALCLLVCLAQSKETHQNLLQPDIVEQLLKSVESREQDLHSGKDLHFQLLICYMGVVLAQMILGSTSLLHDFPATTLLKMEKVMEDLLQFDPLEIGKYEHQIGIEWGSFLPLMFLYEPPYISSPSKSNDRDLSKLSQLSTDVLLLSLQSTAWRERHIQVMIDEGLLDYLVILPWFVPPSSKDRARNVVREVTKVQLIQPPSLCTLCKGSLAKVRLGLNSFMNMTSIAEILSQIS